MIGILLLCCQFLGSIGIQIQEYDPSTCRGVSYIDLTLFDVIVCYFLLFLGILSKYSMAK